MYLSCLEIDVEKPRGRNWLGNPYRVHQRLMMAFPDGQAGRLLFRIEDQRIPPRILIQSPQRGDWEAAFANQPVLLPPYLQKEVTLVFARAQRLRFFLRANPTVRRARWEGEGEARKPVPGPRMGLVKEAEQREWLARKGELGGFRPLAYEVLTRGKLEFKSSSDEQTQTHLCVDLEGYIEVTDPQAFRSTWEQGIGTSKGFGFGMLSIAPA